MSNRHIERVKAFLQSPAAAGVTTAERLVLLVIADGIYANRETVGNHPGWSIEDLVGVAELRRVLARLARHGLDVRVAHALDARGRPMYAYRGKQAIYRLPEALNGGPESAPFSAENGGLSDPLGGLESPAKGTEGPPTGPVGPPFPDLPDSPDLTPPGGGPGGGPAGADPGGEELDDQEHRRAGELVDQLQHRQGIGRLKADGRRRLVDAMERARGRGVSWIQIRESADPSLDGARDRAKVLAMRVDALDPPPAPPSRPPRAPAPPPAFVEPPPAYAAARAALRKPPGRK